MKKIFAIIISLVLMLSVSASAAGLEIRLDSFKATEGGEVTMELTDPGLRLAFAEGETALEAIITIGAEAIMAKMTGITGVYGVNLEQLAALAETTVGTVTESAGIEPEFTEEDMTILTEMGEILTGALETGMYASEDGTTMGIKVTDAEARKLLPLIVKLAENHPEILESAEIPAEVLSELTIPEEVAIVVDAYLTNGEVMAAGLKVDLTAGEETLTIELIAETDMASYVRIALDCNEGETSVAGLEIVIGISETDGAWLIPADTEYIDIASITDDQMTVLMTEAEELLSMFGF